MLFAAIKHNTIIAITIHIVANNLNLTDFTLFFKFDIIYSSHIPTSHYFISNLYPTPLIVSMYFPFFPNLCLIFFI